MDERETTTMAEILDGEAYELTDGQGWGVRVVAADGKVIFITGDALLVYEDEGDVAKHSELYPPQLRVSLA